MSVCSVQIGRAPGGQPTSPGFDVCQSFFLVDRARCELAETAVPLLSLTRFPPGDSFTVVALLVSRRPKVVMTLRSRVTAQK